MTNITENSNRVRINYLWGGRSGWSFDYDTGFFVLDSTNGNHVPYFQFRAGLGRRIKVIQTNGITYLFRQEQDAKPVLIGEFYNDELYKLGLNYLHELKATIREDILQELDIEYKKDLAQNLQEVVDNHCSCCSGWKDISNRKEI